MGPRATYSNHCTLALCTLRKQKVSVCEDTSGHYERRGSGRDDQVAYKESSEAARQEFDQSNTTWNELMGSNPLRLYKSFAAFVQFEQAELASAFRHMLPFTAASLLEHFHGKLTLVSRADRIPRTQCLQFWHS